MIVLTETTDNIQVVLGGSVTTNQLQCVTSWRDVTTTTYTPGRTVVVTNNTTDVNIVPAPGASTQRVVDFISVYNNDTVVQNVTIKFDDNGTDRILRKVDVPAGSTLYYQEGLGWSVANSIAYGYTLNLLALSSSPTDAQTIYFGNKPAVPSTTAGLAKVYIRKAGTIKIAEIYTYATTAGTAENWSFYVRVNNSADTLIATLGAASNERIFSNTSLSIVVAVGDYIEIKAVNPTWATNPATMTINGYIYIE